MATTIAATKHTARTVVKPMKTLRDVAALSATAAAASLSMENTVVICGGVVVVTALLSATYALPDGRRPRHVL
jgi:hypothetical protein